MVWAGNINNKGIRFSCAVAIAFYVLSGIAYGQMTVPEVSIPSGAAIYNFPITVPPGALTPNLTLTYNSQRKSSWLGMGWDLDVGYIQRSTKWGVDYNNNGEDPVRPAFVASLNGSLVELVRRSDWDSGDLTCFGAKTGGDPTKYCRTASDGWEVTTSDGMTHYFGGTTASRQDFDPPLSAPDPHRVIFKWCLDKVQDTSGNYMTMSYVKPPYQIYLNRIDYNFKADGTAANWITFTMDFMISAEEEAPQYTANYRVAADMKLTAINVYGLDGSGSASLEKSYNFAYNTYCPTGAVCINYFSSMLLSLTESAPDGTTLPPVSFTYQWATMEFTKAGTAIPKFENAIIYNSSTRRDFNLTGDFDGDGRTDIASWIGGVAYHKQLNISLSRTKSQDQFEPHKWPTATTPNGADGDFSADGNNRPRFWVGDFNGDGKTDVATIDHEGLIWVFISTGQDFAGGVRWNPWSNNDEKKVRKAHTDARYIQVGDFNGDGRADMISWVSDKFVRVFLSNTTGDGFEINDWSGYFCKNGKGMLMWLGDFNGDGKTDIAAWDRKRPGAQLIIHISNGSGFDRAVWAATSPAKFHNDGTYGALMWLGDFNGDGKTDIASWNSRTAGRSLWIHISTGGFFISHEGFLDASRPMSKNPKYGPFLGDFDGDGRTDMATIKNGTTIDMYRSTGYGFETLRLNADVRGDGSNGGRIWLGDFDGDGRTDIAGWNSNEPMSKDHATTLHMHYYRDKPIRYLLSGVHNGIGDKATIEYKSSAVCNHIDDGSGVPGIPCFSGLPFNIPIVDKIRSEDGSGNVSTTTYDYDSALYVRSATEREFYGFKNIRATHSSGMTK